jgi:FKBP-type peptidyl-prolyl cis-trans isomerase FkpA
MRYFLSFFALLGLFSTGCKDDYLTAEEQLVEDKRLISEYLASKQLTAQSTASGLHYIIDTPGTGDHPNINSNVTVRYKGYYLDGTVFDDTKGGKISLFLYEVIKGWQEGIPLLKREGKAQLFIPSELGYGPRPPSGVRANAVLVFEVELTDFK